MNLYELSARVRELEDWLDEHDGDVSGVEEGFDRAYFDAVGAFDEKVDNYCGLIAELEKRADARKEESRRMADLAKYDARKADRLKSTLLEVLTARDVKRVDAPRFRVTVCNNGGRQPVEMDPVSVEELPEQYRVVRLSVDKGAVYDALSSGEELPFARLLPRGQHVRIK